MEFILHGHKFITKHVTNKESEKYMELEGQFKEVIFRGGSNSSRF